MHNFLFALRYLSKLRGNNVIRVVSLSLGLAVGLLLFSYAHYELTFDRCFRDGERICQLWSVYDGKGFSPQLFAPVGPALAEEIPQVEAATRLFGPMTRDVVRNDNSFPMKYLCADTVFFDVMGFEVLRGDPHEILRHEDQVLLSESAAAAIFGGKDPVGQQILRNGTEPLTVMGIFADLPVNQHLGRITMLCSIEEVIRVTGASWNRGDSYRTYLKLRPGASISEVEAQIPAFCDRHNLTEGMKEFKEVFRFFPIADSSRIDSSLVLVAWIILALAALSLFVASMNYVLVSVSTLVSRGRTIAMLKVSGARRKDIFAVFCWETVLLTLASAAVAVFLIWGLQVQVRQVTGASVGELFSFDRVWIPLCVIVSAFALAALIPARLFTTIPVTLAFRGAAVNKKRWKQALLFCEVLCVTLVTVLLVVFGLQFDRLRNGDAGFDHDRLVYTNVEVPYNRLGSICDAFAAMPEVEAAGVCWQVPLFGYAGQPCFDEVTREMLFACRMELCNEKFIPAMNMQIVQGRNFTPMSAPLEAIVNETYVRKRGWKTEEAVGRQIVDNDDPKSKFYTIVGVVRDFRTSGIQGTVEPLVMHPYNYWGVSSEDVVTGCMMIRLRGRSSEALAAVQRKIEEFPSANNHKLLVYDEQLGDALADVRAYRNIIFSVCCIVLLIAAMGLVGYLNDEIGRRGKEVAVRRVNGASTGSVIRLLGRDITLICIPAVSVGVALSYWCAEKVLSMFVEPIALRWWIFGVCVAFVACTIACAQLVRTWRIANANPAERLKSE